MATVRDLSGNCPMGGQHVDPAIDYNGDPAGVEFTGRVQVLTLGAASVQSLAFGNLVRWIRISPEGDCHYSYGLNPTAAKDSTQFLADGAIEYLRARPGYKLAVIQDNAQTDKVEVAEDK